VQVFGKALTLPQHEAVVSVPPEAMQLFCPAEAKLLLLRIKNINAVARHIPKIIRNDTSFLIR